MPEPTVDSESTLAPKPERELMPEVVFGPKPKAITGSDHMREPATTSIFDGILVEYDMEHSLAHTPTAEGVLCPVPIKWYDEYDCLISRSLVSAGLAQLQVSFVTTGPA